MPASPYSPLLRYRTTVTPARLQVNADTPTPGRVNLAVFPGSEDIDCVSVEIAVPADGTRGRAYFTEEPTPTCSSSEWGFEIDSGSGQQLAVPGSSTGSYYLVTFLLRELDHNVINYHLDFGLSGPLVTAGGPLVCHLLEHSKPSAQDSSYTRKHRRLTVAVVEPG